MFVLFLAIAVLAWTPLFAVYCLYYFCVLKNEKSREYLHVIGQLLTKPTDLVNTPSVTVLVTTRNEESTISEKIQNLAELDFDRDKIDVIIVDDNSEDRTCEFALSAFKRLGLQGTIVEKSHRSGTNASYNTGMREAKGDIILLTDADVMVKEDSLKKALTIITSVKDVGAVTACAQPVSSGKTSATTLEKTYNSFYSKMLTAESAVHSTFPGYGGFTLLRKEAFLSIPIDYGSKDCNIALSTLRKGFRYICVPDIVFYEKISEKLKDQMKQKTRRAARLIQSTVLNYDIAFKKEYRLFGKLIFPLRFAMIIICPVLAFIGFLAALVLMFHLSTVLGLLLVSTACFFLFLGTRTSSAILSFFSSFAFHQFYLVLGLILSPKKMSVWN